MAYDVPQLLAMSQTQLDDLFRASPPGDIPDGQAKGTANQLDTVRSSLEEANG